MVKGLARDHSELTPRLWLFNKTLCRGICPDHIGTEYGATAEVMVKILSALEERGKQLNLILKMGNGKVKEILKWKKEEKNYG